MTSQLISMVNASIKHLTDSKVQECSLQILNHPKILEVVIKGKIYPVKKFLRNYLGLDKLKRGTSTLSKDFWLLRGWNDLEIKQKIHNQTSKINYADFSPYSKNSKHYKGLSNDDIKILIKSKRPCSTEYWMMKGFSYENSLTKVTHHQQNASKAGNSNYANDRTSTQVKYWLRHGLSLEESKKKVSERNSCNKIQNYIINFGLKKGVLKYLVKIAKDRSFTAYKRQSIVAALWECRKLKTENQEIFFEIQKHKLKEIKVAIKGHASRESLLILLPIYELLKDKFTCHIGTHGKTEFFIYRENGRKFRYDFVIQELKIIIEYDGLWFHSTNVKVDQEKTELAKKHGFNIIRLEGMKNYTDYSVGRRNLDKIICTLQDKGVIIHLQDIHTKFVFNCLKA